MTSHRSAHGRSTRRRFLKGSLAAVAVPWVVRASALGEEKKPAPSQRVTLGVIGVGPRATYDLKSMLKLSDVQCVAVADVQAQRRQAGKQLVDSHYGNRDCKTYRDFRDLLARDDIDAVLIATGDRWHAPASILAAEAGKDVYCEKPCGITIELCQRLEETFRRTGRVFQAGTQRRSVTNFQAAVQLVQSGKLGRIHTLIASVYQPVLKNDWLPPQPTPDPEVVDWNLWLGPAPWRPYNQQYVRGGWRGYWDFDSGARLLDWGAHTVDLCQWAIGADDTMPVEYEPQKDKIICRYANGVQLVLQFLKAPFRDRSPHFIHRLGTCPVRFVGEKGWVETGDSGQIVVQPRSLQAELPRYKRVRGLDVMDHARNFFDCVKSRRQPVTNALVMRRSHVACHAAALSWILGRKLRLNPAKEEFIHDAEANRLRTRPERRWS